LDTGSVDGGGRDDRRDDLSAVDCDQQTVGFDAPDDAVRSGACTE
jgi:hypothetical protein